MQTVKCRGCDKDILASSMQNGLCVRCRYENKEGSGEHTRAAPASEIILTTETAHDMPVEARLGIVTSETVFGVNVFKDIFADVRGVFGGRSQTMQKVLRDARDSCLTELRKEAFGLGADAVVGIDLDYQDIGSNAKMVMLVASGTAVKLKGEDQ